MNFDKYFSTINEKKKKLLFRFPLTSGGIGDMIKFFVCALDAAMRYDLKLCFLKNDNPITKYLIPKCEHIYVDIEELDRKIVSCQHCTNIEDLVNTIEDGYAIQISPHVFYDMPIYDIVNKYDISDIFKFSDDIYKMKKDHKISEEYVSLHIRRGDKHIEASSSVKQVPHDSRPFDQTNFDNVVNKLFAENKNVMLFSDSMVFKKMMSKKFDKLQCLDLKIGHTTWTNTSDEQIKNTVFEFYILCNSVKIIANCVSGFSKIASMINKIDVEHYESDDVPVRY